MMSKKHSSLGLTDPNLAFWEENFDKIIENQPFLEQNLLFWAEILYR